MVPLTPKDRWNGSISWGWMIFVALGAATFWLPTVILHGYAGCGERTFHVAVWATAVAPVTGSLGLAFLRHRRRPIVRALLMLLGVWSLGGPFMSLSATFCGGGFRQAASIPAVILGLLPPYTYIMAAYDGSLGALLVVSALLPFAGAVLELLARLRSDRAAHFDGAA